MKLVQHSLKTIRRQLDVPLRRQMVWVVLFAVAIGGTGFWLIQTAEPQGDEARRDVGSALLSGAVLSTVFVFAERRIEQAVTERQTREQYQLALSMERDLTDRDFSGLNLRGIVLTGRDLSGSRLVSADLTGAYLPGAVLTGAGLHSAVLTGANLTDANLTFAYLGGANLTGAVLTGAVLTGANLGTRNRSLAMWDASTVWPDGFTPPRSA